MSINQALLPDSFEFSIQGDAECGPVNSHTPFPGHPMSFDNEDSSTMFRPAGLGPLSQSSIHPLSLHTTSGFDYRVSPSTLSGSDPSFQDSLGISSRSSSSASPSSSTSTYAILSGHNSHYPFNPNIPFHPSSHSSVPPSTIHPPSSIHSQSVLQNPLEVRPRLTSISNASGMPPPLRSSTFSNPVSPPLGSSYRHDYSNTISQFSRHAIPNHSSLFQLSPSPQSSLSVMSRSLESSAGRESPTSQHYKFATPMQLETNSSLSAGSQSVPPFNPMKSIYSLSDGRGAAVQADIQAKIDKGFFRADQDWTCYRRNYFSVVCSYNLRADVEINSEQLFLHKQGSLQRVSSFAMCIAAKVDGEDGKPIELVQHTPKRDKGPMGVPEKKDLKPNPSGNLGTFQGSPGFSPNASISNDYDRVYPTLHESQTVANFERIQFKKATANNGKRRAAQQYFHIMVELYAKVYEGKSTEAEWVKFAHRVSAQMVVRGRSPGHYQDERRGSSTNMGPGGGSAGDFNGIHRDAASIGHSGSSLGGIAGPSGYARLGGAYQGHHASMALSPPSDSHSMPSSASSSFGSGAFMAAATTGAQGSSLSMDHNSSSSMDAYYHSDRYENNVTPRSMHSNPLARSSLTTSGHHSSSGSGGGDGLTPPSSLHESPFGYSITPSPPIKEEVLRFPPIKFGGSGGGRYSGNVGYPFLSSSPPFGGGHSTHHSTHHNGISSWQGMDAYATSRDCKPLFSPAESPHKTFFPEMSAL